MTHTAIALILVLFCSPDARAGGEDTPVERLAIGSLLKIKEPSWVLEKKEKAGSAVTYDFTRDGQRLVVSVTAAESVEAAKSRLEGLAMRITASPTEVQGIGERC